MWDIDLPILLNSSAASANRNVTTLAAQRKVATGTPCECATLCGDPTVRCDFWAWTAAEPPYALGNDDPADNQDGIGVNTTPNSASDSAGQATTAAWPATCFLRTLPHDGRDGITLVFRSSPDYPFLSPLPTRPEQLLPAPPPNPSTNVTTTSPSAACASMCATTDLCAYSIHESHSGVCLLYRGVARAGWAVGVWDDRVPALQPPPPPPPPMVVVAGGDGGEDQPPVVMVWLIVAVAVGTVVVVVAAAWRLHVWRRSKAETRMAAYGA
ncbi:hypothetical protein BDZ88DRAFT_421302 [Geranomyces variabilis]|nr:hypothetical protein BDZ88DRAFT_421302 [Geranomyces variabilis]KAJ3143300.1 hypothetical protein HDU90_000058 [Geranomyces variabilis]